MSPIRHTERKREQAVNAYGNLKKRSSTRTYVLGHKRVQLRIDSITASVIEFIIKGDPQLGRD